MKLIISAFIVVRVIDFRELPEFFLDLIYRCVGTNI